MSFMHNPYNHLELIRGKTGGWYWYCHSCGCEDKDHETTDLGWLEKSFLDHILNSHGRTPSNFIGWSDI